jgi:hypothetical protein
MIRLSLSDQKIKQELQLGREKLLTDESSRSLLSTLRRLLQSITPNLYVVRWIPEQGEDLYHVLIDGKSVAHIEISRVDGDVERVCRTWPVDEYIRENPNMTKLERRKLDIAIELAAGKSP